MIKKRRKIDKKKRRCLYSVEKKTKPIQSIENILSLVEEPPTKKNKNGRITSLIEEKITKDHSTDNESEVKSKSAEKSTEEEKIIEKSEESIGDVKEDVSNPNSQSKTKQRYGNINLICIVLFNI